MPVVPLRAKQGNCKCVLAETISEYKSDLAFGNLLETFLKLFLYRFEGISNNLQKKVK